MMNSENVECSAEIAVEAASEDTSGRAVEGAIEDAAGGVAGEAAEAAAGCEAGEASEDKRVFTNEACPYFPCHRLPEGTRFNCVFCYCPLYALGPDCGGAYRYNEKGYKDCTYCTIMHEGSQGFDRVRDLFPKIAELARREM